MWPCTYLIRSSIIYLQLITFTFLPFSKQSERLEHWKVSVWGVFDDPHFSQPIFDPVWAPLLACFTLLTTLVTFSLRFNKSCFTISMGQNLMPCSGFAVNVQPSVKTNCRRMWPFNARCNQLTTNKPYEFWDSRLHLVNIQRCSVASVDIRFTHSWSFSSWQRLIHSRW